MNTEISCLGNSHGHRNRLDHSRFLERTRVGNLVAEVGRVYVVLTQCDVPGGRGSENHVAVELVRAFMAVFAATVVVTRFVKFPF